MAPESLPPRAAVPVIVSDVRPTEAKSHLALTLFKWHVLILSFGAVLAIAAAVAMTLKPTPPTATARLLLKTGPDTLPIAGLPSGSRDPRDEILQTEAALLGSRIVLVPVARALRTERGDTPSEADLDADVAALRANLVVTVVPNTTLIQANAYGPTADDAQRRLTMILDSYLEQHATAYSGSTSLAGFFEREAGAAAAALQDAEERLQRWQAANQVVAVGEEIRNQLLAVGEFDAALRRADVDIAATGVQIETLTRDIAALPHESVTSRERAVNPLITKLKADLATEEARLRDPGPSPLTERIRMDIAAAEVAARDPGSAPLVAKLRGDVATAEMALNDLRLRYHDQDRRVQEKLDQIAGLRRGIEEAERAAAAAAHERAEHLRHELAAAQRELEAAGRQKIAGLRTQLELAEREGDSFARATVAPHPLREVLQRDLSGARTRLSALRSQRDGLLTHLDQARTRLAHLQATRVDGERLARNVELAGALYQQNMKRLEDARITTGLRRQQLTNLAVIEPPRAIATSLDWKRVAFVTLLGAIVGVALGVAAALALDFFNWSIRTPDDVEFYLGLPTVAALPALPAAKRLPEVPAGRAERHKDVGHV